MEWAGKMPQPLGCRVSAEELKHTVISPCHDSGHRHHRHPTARHAEAERPRVRRWPLAEKEVPLEMRQGQPLLLTSSQSRSCPQGARPALHTSTCWGPWAMNRQVSLMPSKWEAALFSRGALGTWGRAENTELGELGEGEQRGFQLRINTPLNRLGLAKRAIYSQGEDAQVLRRES